MKLNGEVRDSQVFSGYDSERENAKRVKGHSADFMKVVVFWNVTPCRLVNVYRRFEITCCFHLKYG